VADSVEKLTIRRLKSAREKIGLSDRPKNRWQVSVKGMKTPENLARLIAGEFFNRIGRTRRFDCGPSATHKGRSIRVKADTQPVLTGGIPLKRQSVATAFSCAFFERRIVASRLVPHCTIIAKTEASAKATSGRW
jgi:hypothetical protein